VILCNRETRKLQCRDESRQQKNPIRVPGIQEDRGIKRIVNRMGSEDLCSRETDKAVPKKRTGA
jgi:hypothetical protein